MDEGAFTWHYQFVNDPEHGKVLCEVDIVGGKLFGYVIVNEGTDLDGSANAVLAEANSLPVLDASEFNYDVEGFLGEQLPTTEL